jgi:tetratricopeptide (TPR) repeat protein
MTRTGAAGTWLLACAWLAAAAVVLSGHAGPSSPPAIKGLTEAPLLARSVDLIYDADFAAADAALARACGPAPAQACRVLTAVARWWRLYLDIDDRSQDAAFTAQLAGVIAEGERWTKREPDRAEAWLYLGAAYGLRVQFNAQRSEYFAAARDGKRINQALARALALDADLADANAGLGLYRYYADIAPSVLKVLRWFLGLPGGDRAQGLAHLQRARTGGVLLKAEAAYQLHFIDLWYENESGEALEILAELRVRYPHNPIFVLNAAQAHEVYRSDRSAALDAYRQLIDGAQRGSLREPALAESWGRLGAAAQLNALAEPDRAAEEARAVVARKPAAPCGAVAQAQLELGRALDQVGAREAAVAAYRAAAASAPAGDPRGVRRAAQQGVSRVPDRTAAEAMRLSLDGWRAFQRGDLTGAIAPLDRAVQLRPNDGVHHYRRGRVLLASEDRGGARAEFERALQVRPLPPAPLVADSYYQLATILEAAAERARAVSLYQSAARAHGASADTRALAERALARLR